MTTDFRSIPRRTNTVHLSNILPAPFNPPCRTKDVEKVKEDLEAVGQLENVSLVEKPDGTFVIADGHRRIKALEMMGKQVVRATIYTGGKDWEKIHGDLFVKLNASKRRLANRDMCEVGLAGGPIFNNTVDSTVSYIKRLFPNGEVPSILKEAIGSYVLTTAKSTVDYCWTSAEFARGTKAFDTKVRMVLLWLVRHKLQQKVIAYKRLGYSNRILRNAIEKNLPYCPKMGGGSQDDVA